MGKRLSTYTFKKCSIGDCFILSGDMDGYRYMRVEDLYDPYMTVRVNAINLDTGFGKYFFDETKVHRIAISEYKSSTRLDYTYAPIVIPKCLEKETHKHDDI